ncbi:MAG: hypothetical protein GYA50_09770 [Eubacteriaceae bacterium]|nr:hypothetical protein [Eubacteriaceae bacterium]
MIKIISILLLITPIVNILSLHFLKSKYVGCGLKSIHLIILLISIILLLKKVDSALILLSCNLIALLLLIVFEKLYYFLLDKVISPMISQLTEADVVSTLLVTRNNIYAITNKGYVIINYKINDYKMHKEIQEFSTSDQKYFTRLKEHKLEE